MPTNPIPQSDEDELKTFLLSLRVHSKDLKDLDMCFNDAAAVAYLNLLISKLIHRYNIESRIEELEKLKPLIHDHDGNDKVADIIDTRIESLQSELKKLEEK